MEPGSYGFWRRLTLPAGKPGKLSEAQSSTSNCYRAGRQGAEKSTRELAPFKLPPALGGCLVSTADDDRWYRRTIGVGGTRLVLASVHWTDDAMTVTRTARAAVKASARRLPFCSN